MPPEAGGQPPVVDVRGLVCPEPVVRTRAALAAAPGRTVEVLTDNVESRDNIARLGQREGCPVSWQEQEPGVFVVRLERGAGTRPAERTGAALFVASDCLGGGDDKLGRLLMSLFLRTLSERPGKPAHLLLVNGGVRLALEGSDDIATLGALAGSGTAILVCGTCLDYYGVKDRLRVGAVSNMYEIADILLSAQSVVRI